MFKDRYRAYHTWRKTRSRSQYIGCRSCGDFVQDCRAFHGDKYKFDTGEAYLGTRIFLSLSCRKLDTTHFPMLVRSRKLSRYRNESQGIRARSNFLNSLRSSTPLTSTWGLYTVGTDSVGASWSEWDALSDMMVQIKEPWKAETVIHLYTYVMGFGSPKLEYLMCPVRVELISHTREKRREQMGVTR